MEKRRKKKNKKALKEGNCSEKEILLKLNHSKISDFSSVLSFTLDLC